MNIFYTENIKNDLAYLDETDSRHCLKVLRMREGDEIKVVDGKGGFYEGILTLGNRDSVIVEISSSTPKFGLINYHLHIAIAPTKNIERFEWFLEKATEIGISEITPIICERSERKNIREDRLQKILISAIKQSVKAYLPVLNPLIYFPDFLETGEGRKYIAYGNHGNEHLMKVKGSGNKFIVLIGPEGDFSDGEINAAVKMGFLPVSLGESRLRTETAGISVCQMISDRVTINLI